MKKLIVFTCLAICLPGCGFGDMEKGLNALMGKDATTAFSVMGYPSGQKEFGDKTIYFWSVKRTTTVLIPQTANTHGTIGTTPFYGSTTYNQAVSMGCDCLIKLIADKSDKLISYEYNGNLCGCDIYIERLGRYYQNLNKKEKYK